MPFAQGEKEECRSELLFGEETGRELAKKYGVSERTIGVLRKDIRDTGADVEEVSAARIGRIKSTLLGGLYNILQQTFSAITPDKIAKTSAAQLAMISGIIFDKIRLLEGKSTNNHAYSLQAVVEMSISPGGAAAIAAPAPANAIVTNTPAAAQDTPLSRDSKRPETPDGAVTIGAAAAEIIDAETVETPETAGLPETEHPGAAVIPLFPGIRRSEAVAVSSETAAAGGAVVSEDLL